MRRRRILSALDIVLPVVWIVFALVVTATRGSWGSFAWGAAAGVMAARLVVELAFRRGDFVKRGPGVAVIDFRPFIRSLERAQKMTAELGTALAKAELEQAANVVDRLHEAATLEAEHNRETGGKE